MQLRPMALHPCTVLRNMGRADAVASLKDCREDNSRGLSGPKSMEQQVRQFTSSDADVSAFNLQALAEQEPVVELAPLRSAQDCGPHSVHSVETGVGAGSFRRKKLRSLLLPEHLTAVSRELRLFTSLPRWGAQKLWRHC